MPCVPRNFNGSGAGGGSFYGTQTLERGSDGLLGFYSAAPLIAVLSSLPYDVSVQYVSNVQAAYDLTNVQTTINSANKLFFVFNVLPTSPLATSAGQGWSLLTVFRPDGRFEVFALLWTEANSYSFTAALTAFELDPSGKVVASTPTTLDIYIQGTYPTPMPNSYCYSDAVASLRSGFVCSAQLFATAQPQQRSSLLQSYVLGA
jgi:hypothetical protein